MLKRQRIAATLLDPALSLLPEYQRFRDVLREVFGKPLTPEAIERLYAALP